MFFYETMCSGKIIFVHVVSFSFPLAVVQRKNKFTVTDKLLQNHFGCLYTGLEPREIAKEMFKTGHFSNTDYNDVTALPNKYKQLEHFLEILERKHLHVPFYDTLESGQHKLLLEALRTDQPLGHEPCKLTQFSIFKLNATNIGRNRVDICDTFYKAMNLHVILIQVKQFYQITSLLHSNTKLRHGNV